MTARCDLDPPGRWRLNVHVGRAAFTMLIGEDPRSAAMPADLRTADVLVPHPVYATQGRIAIVNPGGHTTPTAIELLREAHEQACRRCGRGGWARP